MRRQAAEDLDVICEQTRRDGVAQWTIRLAGDEQGRRDTLSDAIELARDVAVTNARPAWLLDESGYPLKPMLPWAL